MDIFNENDKMNNNNLTYAKQLKNNRRKIINLIIFFVIIIITLILILVFLWKKITTLDFLLRANILKNINIDFDYYTKLKNEANMPHLKEILKKRIFIERLPLPKEIKCEPHFINEELTAFLSLLTNDTIFFETGSGCSSIIAKYYAKKTYAVEGCKKYYEIGVQNGLKDILIFKNLKPDDPTWSYPGNKSNLNDWKNYFQSYKKEYNADVILIDGRFKLATALDIFDKIRDDTIILLHEYYNRPFYFVIEEYYNYVYHWGSLYSFVKKKNIKQIPLEIQEKYWNQPL
jgi:hypothetical protein